MVGVGLAGIANQLDLFAEAIFGLGDNLNLGVGEERHIGPPLIFAVAIQLRCHNDIVARLVDSILTIRSSGVKRFPKEFGK